MTHVVRTISVLPWNCFWSSFILFIPRWYDLDLKCCPKISLAQTCGTFGKWIGCCCTPQWIRSLMTLQLNTLVRRGAWLGTCPRLCDLEQCILVTSSSHPLLLFSDHHRLSEFSPEAHPPCCVCLGVSQPWTKPAEIVSPNKPCFF